MRSVRQLPLRVRYAVTIAVALILFGLLVWVVQSHRNVAAGLPANADPAQAAAQQRQDLILVAQQQAPHVSAAAVASPQGSAVHAVDAYFGAQVSASLINGPVDGPAHCVARGAASANRAAFGCRISAGPSSALLNYPFDVVVDRAQRRVTLCQVVTSPLPTVPSPPVSARCR